MLCANLLVRVKKMFRQKVKGKKNLTKATKKEKEYFLHHISSSVNFESKGIKRGTL
jgi:hypothetical protein